MILMKKSRKWSLTGRNTEKDYLGKRASSKEGLQFKTLQLQQSL